MIDDNIRDALKVDPSPEFLARIRARVAEEPEPSAWRWSWMLTAAGAIAAAVVVAVIVSKPEPRMASAPDVAQALRPATSEPDVVQAFRPATPGPEPATAGLKPRTTSVVRSAPSAAPEILIDPREQQALRQLIVGVRDGRVDLSAAHNSTTTTLPELEPVTDIVIPPITIDPLAPLSGAEGVRQ